MNSSRHEGGSPECGRRITQYLYTKPGNRSPVLLGGITREAGRGTALDGLDLRLVARDDVGWQGPIVRRSVLLPAVRHPPQQVSDGKALIGIGLVLVDQQPRESRDGIGVRARSIDEEEAQIVRDGRDAVRGGGNSVRRRYNERAVMALDSRIRDVVGDHVRQLIVADRVLRVLDLSGHAVIAFGAEADRPVDGRRRAGAVLPGIADGSKIVGENASGAAAIGPVDDVNGLAGQGDARVVGGDRRVVPGLDRAEEDFGERVAGKLQVRRAGNLWDVIRDCDATNGGWNLDGSAALGRSYLRIGHRRVGGAEVHGLAGELRDAGPAAHRLIGYLGAALHAGVILAPLREERVDEG